MVLKGVIIIMYQAGSPTTRLTTEEFKAWKNAIKYAEQQKQQQEVLKNIKRDNLGGGGDPIDGILRGGGPRRVGQY